MSRPPAAFVLSLDFELIWGTLDLHGVSGYGEICRLEREQVFDKLLALLDEFETRASWLVVGHLALEGCPTQAPHHPQLARPQHAWARNDWFALDPGGDERQAPLFFARSLIERLGQTAVRHEIGCHSFSHVIYGDPGCSEAAARGDLEAAVAALAGIGVAPRSFSFPRNRVGHAELLAQHGFSCFRTPEPRWYCDGRWPDALRRAGHLVDVVTARTPGVCRPRRRADGVVELPGSMLYFPMHGRRRHLPLALRIARARKGIAAAIAAAAVFHLWTHPTNLADPMAPMFRGLRRILEAVRAERERGRLEVLTMGEVARDWQRFAAPGAA